MKTNDINKLQDKIYQNKVNKGFNITDIGYELLLITEEIGEVVRAYRRETKEKLIEETVDVIIYCLGLLKILGADAATEISKKVDKNEGRVYKKVNTKFKVEA